MTEWIEQAAIEAGIEADVAKLMAQSAHVKQFAAVIAAKQRKADADFLSREGKSIVVACQQKAVRHILERLEGERLVTE